MSLLGPFLPSQSSTTTTTTPITSTTPTTSTSTSNNNNNNNNNNTTTNTNTNTNNSTSTPSSTASTNSPSTSPSPVPSTTTTPTNTTNSTPTASIATPTPTSNPNPNTNSTTPNTTDIRTITTGTGNDASVVVITQTAYAPTSTSDVNSSNNDNRATASTSRIIAIAIPSAIGGLAAIIILVMGIRALLRRSAAKRAADDIRWPETVTSEGDRAALYPEPTRPSPGHGLGLVEDEEDITDPEVNMAGAGAGRLRTGAHPGPTRSHSVTTNGLSSNSHYQAYEYGNTSDYMHHGIPPPPPPPPSHIPSSLMPAYGMNQMEQKGMVTYPPDWGQGNGNGYRNVHSPEMIARTHGPTRTSLIHPHDPYANWEPTQEVNEPNPNRQRYSGSQPYLLPPMNSNHSGSPSSNNRNSLSNGGSEELQPSSSETHPSSQTTHPLDGPREIQYTPYSHGGYGGEMKEEEDDDDYHHHQRSQDLNTDHSNQDFHEDSMSSRSDPKGSPGEWKLGVNNPDTTD
ncbi:hypothetical protein DFH28DRAFT_1126369 [Melampsora americana]|nr:hypothetical protein DFH28DRAFT_1126369 [Melampsora americana]